MADRRTGSSKSGSVDTRFRRHPLLWVYCWFQAWALIAQAELEEQRESRERASKARRLKPRAG
jgi:hypothetical protein